MARVPSIVVAFLRWLRPTSLPSDLPEHLLLGQRGEVHAATYLKRKGYRVLRRNFTAGPGSEIDIVCRDKHARQLVFVEVKTRSSDDFGRPIVAVDRKKRRAMIRGAMRWLRMLGMPDISFRFDVIEVMADPDDVPMRYAEITHIENAFQMPRRFSY